MNQWNRASLLSLLISLSTLFGSAFADPTLSDLRAIIAQSDVNSVETFLAKLHQNDPQYFARFTLMRESASLQGATPENPRVILFGETGRTLLTFNGSTEQENGDHIEMIIARGEPLESFSFFEIDFATGKGQLSEENPSKCMRCHGTKGKPIWQPYDFWPGAYGEDDDALIDFSPSRYPNNPGRSTEQRHRLHRDQFIAFRDSAGQHARYQWLQFPETEESRVAPYSERRRSGSYPPLRPNLQLTHLLTPLQGQNVAKQMQQSQCFSSWGPIAAIQLMECDMTPTLKQKYQELGQRMAPMVEKHQSSMPWERYAWTRFPGNPDAPLRKLSLSQLGIDAQNWSTSFPTANFQHFAGVLYLKDAVLEALFNVWQPQAPSLPSYLAILAELYPSYYGSNYNYGAEESEYEEDPESGYPVYIATAREKACTALFEMVPQDEPLRDCIGEESSHPDLGAKVEGLCRSCHDGSNAAPDWWLMTADRESWVERVRERIEHADPTLRMPPDRPLTPEEKSAVLEYWRSL